MLLPVYCPRCGALMERRFTEGRDRDVCPACGYVFYRNPVPAVGVVVALDEGIVLIRRKYEPRAGYWGLPAGFMELDESAEEAAVRECHEETGLLVQIDHLLGVFSFGEGEQSGLVIIYAATAVGGALVAGDDATEAGVFPLDALPAPMAFRSQLQAIERWRRTNRPSRAILNLLDDQGQPFVIRRAVRADAAAALDLLLAGRAAGEDQSLAADALFHDWLHDPDRPILVVELDGLVEGVAALSFHQALRGWFATLDDIVVAPEQRRRGLGTALVATASRLAREHGCVALHALPLEQDPGARSFLAACGFTPGGALTLRLYSSQ